MDATPRRNLAWALLESLWSRGDEGPVRAVAAPDFRHQLSHTAEAVDLDGYCALVAGFRSAFDPIDLLPHRTLVDGDRIVAHYSLTGDHVGAFLGVEATGTVLWVPAMTFMTFRDEGAGPRLVRQASLTDFLSVQRQLRQAS